ncbi:MAG: hypothetical protein JW839_17970 [Candidatus Lokiarchaeota archaeon]|nr:hypothetical protein [Candidatus Lokiarchaeota archaeon]
MRRLRRVEVERRLAICQAKEEDPTLRYVDLQVRFHAGPSIVAIALKAGADTWLLMLGRAPAKAKAKDNGIASSSDRTSDRWEYLAVEVSSIEGGEGTITYQARDDGDEEPGITGVATMADALGAYGKLGWELAGMQKVGRGGVAFAGAWEAVFKRRFVSKEARKTS